MKKVLGRFIIMITIIFTFILFSYYQSKYSLMTTSYSIQSNKIDESIRIVQLTDLHNSEFGNGNTKLVKKVRELSPDIICITGDLLNGNNSNTNVATNLIKDLAQMAPVYISYGNHEVAYEKNYSKDLKTIYEENGAHVLKTEYEDIIIKGSKIRIGGIYGYCMPEKFLENGPAKNEEIQFLKDFMNTDSYTLLLCHMPYTWLHQDGLKEWDINLVLSGHVHGGQIILPFIGGIYAPDEKLFPGKLEGQYESDGHIMILSRGLGSNEKIPRLNNIPEVVLIEL